MRNIVRVRMQGSSRVRPCPSVFRNVLVSLCKSSFTPMARPLAAVSAAMWYLRRERVRNALRGTCIILLLVLAGMNLRYSADRPENNSSNTWDTPLPYSRDVHKTQDDFLPTSFATSSEYLTYEELRQRQTGPNIHVDHSNITQTSSPTSRFNVGVQQAMVLLQSGDAPRSVGIDVLTVTGCDRRALYFTTPIDESRLARAQILTQHLHLCVVEPTNFNSQSLFEFLHSSNAWHGVGTYVERRYQYRLRLPPYDIVEEIREQSKMLQYICSWDVWSHFYMILQILGFRPNTDSSNVQYGVGEYVKRRCDFHPCLFYGDTILANNFMSKWTVPTQVTHACCGVKPITNFDPQFLDNVWSSSSAPYGVGTFVKRRCDFHPHLFCDDTMERNGELLKLMYLTCMYGKFFKSKWRQPFRVDTALLTKFYKWVKGQWVYSRSVVGQPPFGSGLSVGCRIVASVVSCVRPPSHWCCSSSTPQPTDTDTHDHITIDIEYYDAFPVCHLCLILTTILIRMIPTHQRGLINQRHAPKTRVASPSLVYFTQGRSDRRIPRRARPFGSAGGNHDKQKSQPKMISTRQVIRFIMFIICLNLPLLDAAPKKGGSSGETSVPRPSDFTANLQEKWDFLPGMQKWDGIPHHDFLKVWFAALMVALGSVVQAGYTLLECAEQTDAGRGGTGSAEDQRDHTSRSTRLYACIMNYINPTCRIHRTARTEFPNDGPGLFAWLKVVGQLKLDRGTHERLMKEFDEATMARAGIEFTPEAVFKWLNYVDELGDKIGKSLRQKRTRYLEGFPESFDSVITAERMCGDEDGTYKIPNTYPAHHPKAGTAHPDRGKPDLDAMATAFYPEWTRKIHSGAIRRVPKGSVYQVHDDVNDSDQPGSDDGDHDGTEGAFAVSRGRIDARWVCLVCGGLGHASNVDGMQCLTAQLNIRIPKNQLTKIRYPSDVRVPRWTNDRSAGGSSDRRDRRNERRNESARVTERDDEDANYTSSRRPHERSRKHKKEHKKRRPKESARRAASEQSASESSSDSSGSAPEAKFASVYHTIDIRDSHYQSYSSDSSRDESPNPNKPSSSRATKGSSSKSATTKATAP